MAELPLTAEQYHEPTSISDALRSSMNDERVAANFYRLRAAYARMHGDEVTAKLLEDIAEEEEGHLTRFQNRLTEPECGLAVPLSMRRASKGRTKPRIVSPFRRHYG